MAFESRERGVNPFAQQEPSPEALRQLANLEARDALRELVTRSERFLADRKVTDGFRGAVERGGKALFELDRIEGRLGGRGR
jgi:hypothetical protein